MQRFSRRTVVRGIGLLITGSVFATGSRSISARDLPLAIKGYDPVAYFTMGKAEQGLPDIEHQWDERRYRFSRTEHRELFKADPVRYAPQFADYCAMALSEGELHEADPQNWLIADGKLYIFGEAYGPALFRKRLAENIAKANANRTLLPRY